ncbi:sugar nucleotide-binding protein [Flavobacterium johnsoniae]|uniref:SDR family oxidoreductase n=1 Tax=Flavobacterium johnsoniae TaxID=986 RepID=UPI0025B0EDD1|nr:sugar nucleotide-binding protein [Flavobacterium johnsoniae]WJS95165.1 sugar nucleotide-binding protein [Flavobacterium johnsoniae]
MNFFILGCNGMAGHIISLYLKEQGHSVLGFARTKSKYVDNIVGDAFNTALLKNIIQENNFDVVVNCIGMLNQFAEQDKASSSFLNSYLPHFLAESTENKETQIIHMSTDCVFSGKRGNYTENDFCDGETFYDRSKALGELSDLKNITFRNSIIGPDINEKGIGLLNWFMGQSGEINGYTKSIWTGQTTLQLAKTIEKAAMAKVYGLYNAVPDHSISKFELLKLFNRYFKGDSLDINPVEGILADKSLKRTKFEFDYLIPDYETMIAELADWIKNHKEMYPHYNIF